MLKFAKTYGKTGNDETIKSGFYYSHKDIVRVAIAHGFKLNNIFDALETITEADLHRLMVALNVKAKTCKTACVITHDNALFYGFNHDCGIAVFSGGGNLIFHTPNNSQFGVFSSHRSYEPYISTGVIPVEKGYTVVLYSGSFDQIVKNPNFHRTLFDKKFEQLIDALIEKENVQKEKEPKEKALVVFSLD